MDAGDLTERLELKRRLQCKPFSWFLDNIWPELFVYSKDVLAWGSVRSVTQPYIDQDNQYVLGLNCNCSLVNI